MRSNEQLRARVRELLNWPGPPPAPAIEVLQERRLDGFTELLVEYRNLEREAVRAFLLRPAGRGPFPGVVVHHQHNGQRHLGKSEVNGSAGDPLQAFGPWLARCGFVVLAPDAICFEDRRRGATGTEASAEDERQHFNEMAYRLVAGSLLMSVVAADAALAVSALAAADAVDPGAIGMLGHSMGGHTTLFAAALDERVRFACISGALCGYQARMAAGVSIELAQIIPGMVRIADFDGLLGLIAPRPVMIVSASADPYSCDAPAVVARAREQFQRGDASDLLVHAHFSGAHALTEERVWAMDSWLRSFANPVR
jgi:dienelactone hydrolase